MIGTSAINGSVFAPTTSAIKGEDMQMIGYPVIQDNTLICPQNAPTTKIRAFLAIYSDLGFLDKQTKILASKGVYMDFDQILWKLGMCESGFQEKKCIIDTNNKLSCGFFMYQQATWDKYCRGDILNGKDQTKCATDMIMGGGWMNWFNCFNMMDLPKI